MDKAERFWSMVDRRGPDECWLKAGWQDRDGYVRFGRVKAHRFAYELAVGPIPPGLVVDHVCFNRACVNPAHLQALTVSENCRITRPHMVQACPLGHLYDEKNTYYRPDQRRVCRTCSAAAGRRYWGRKRVRSLLAPSAEPPETEPTNPVLTAPDLVGPASEPAP